MTVEPSILHRPILCIDFDGVLHDYHRGWQHGEIYGQITDGFFEWSIKAMSAFQLVIYSSRSKSQEGITAMRAWLLQQAAESAPEIRGLNTEIVHSLVFASEKPSAFLTIDDRAIQFSGSWRDPALDPQKLRAFKPWNVTKPIEKENEMSKMIIELQRETIAKLEARIAALEAEKAPKTTKKREIKPESAGETGQVWTR